MREKPTSLGRIVEYLERGKIRRGMVVAAREAELAVVDANGVRRSMPPSSVLFSRNSAGRTVGEPAEQIRIFEAERAQFLEQIDLDLLWGVVHDQGRAFSADELAELFFSARSPAAGSAMFEALLSDQLFFARRHLEFVPRAAEQVERLRVQRERESLKSTSARQRRALIQALVANEPADPEQVRALADDLERFLFNPFTRSRELATLLAEAIPEVQPAETAFEILDRLGRPPTTPRFVAIAGLRTEFDPAAIAEASQVEPPARAPAEPLLTVAIDDEETLEVDDALGCCVMSDGNLKVTVHIALVSDFVARGSVMDREAAARATTFYLPEAVIRMLPDEVSCRRASLLAGQERNVLTTELRMSAAGEILDYAIYPSRIRIDRRMTYAEADRLLEQGASNGRQGDAGPDDAQTAVRDVLERLYASALRLKERRLRTGAANNQRREAKVRVVDGRIELAAIDASSPSRTLVAEFMVASNWAGARYAADKGIPIIYRVAPNGLTDAARERARLSLNPGYHAGLGLDCYAQLSSPIRRYTDLVLQRQLLAVSGASRQELCQSQELLQVMANAEATEFEARQLERRARRYWALRYLAENALDRPLEAIVLRDGASAELFDYAVRGTLYGAPNLATNQIVTVKIGRIDPLRGWLTMEYMSPSTKLARALP